MERGEGERERGVQGSTVEQAAMGAAIDIYGRETANTLRLRCPSSLSRSDNCEKEKLAALFATLLTF